MNIYKNLLFLHGYIVNPRDLEDPDGAEFAQGYGNRVASGRQFAPLGHGQAKANVAATRTAAPDLCPTGTCG